MLRPKKEQYMFILCKNKWLTTAACTVIQIQILIRRTPMRTGLKTLHIFGTWVVLAVNARCMLLILATESTARASFEFFFFLGLM